MASVAALMTALPMECSPSRKLHPSDLDQDLVTDMPEAVASTNKRKTLRSWLASWRFPASNTAAGRRGNSGNGRLGQEVDAGKSPLKWTCKFATPKRPKATKDDTSPAIFTTHTAAATSSSISTPASQSQVLVTESDAVLSEEAFEAGQTNTTSSSSSLVHGLFPLKCLRDLPKRPRQDKTVLYMRLRPSQSTQSWSSANGEAGTEGMTDRDEATAEAPAGLVQTEADVEDVDDDECALQVTLLDLAAETCDICLGNCENDRGQQQPRGHSDGQPSSSSATTTPEAAELDLKGLTTWSAKLCSPFRSRRKMPVRGQGRAKTKEERLLESTLMREDLLTLYLLRLEEEANYFKTSTPVDDQELCDCPKCQNYYLEYYSRYLEDYERKQQARGVTSTSTSTSAVVEQCETSFVMDDIMNNGMTVCSIM